MTQKLLSTCDIIFSTFNLRPYVCLSLCLIGIYYDSFKSIKLNKQLILNFSSLILFSIIYVFGYNLYQQNTIFINVSNSLFLSEYQINKCDKPSQWF